MATTEVDIVADAWTVVAASAAFTCQNKSRHVMLLASAASLPAAASEVGFVLRVGDSFQEAAATKTYYARLLLDNSDTTSTGKMAVEI